MNYLKTLFTSIAIPNCGSFSLLDLVQDVMEFETLQESVDFIVDYFNLNKAVRGFGKQVKSSQQIKREPPKRKEVDFNEILPQYDEHILNTFCDYHPIEWLYEGITDETMDKYEITFNLDSEGIIIPHRDINGRLVGIRQRNLNERQLILKRKYVPYTSFRSKITYRHALSKSMYGIHINKEAIIQSKKCIIWESEKSVLKMDSYYGNNPSVCVGGSSISDYQLNMLKKLEVRDIYVFFDYEKDNQGWNKKMNKIYTRIANWGFNCYYISNDDMEKYLNPKDSPIDINKEIFETLLKLVKKFEL